MASSDFSEISTTKLACRAESKYKISDTSPANRYDNTTHCNDSLKIYKLLLFSEARRSKGNVDGRTGVREDKQ